MHPRVLGETSVRSRHRVGVGREPAEDASVAGARTGAASAVDAATVRDGRVKNVLKNGRARVHKSCRRLTGWWAMTTDAEYLASMNSRRRFLAFLWVTAIVFVILNEAAKGKVVVGLLIVLLLAFRISSSTLLRDLVLCGSFSVYFLVGYHCLLQAEGAAVAGKFLMTVQRFFGLLALTGVHSSLHSLLSLILAINVLFVQTDPAHYIFAVSTAMTTLVCWTLEYACATNFHEFQSQRLAMEKLLDHATDGFCNIEIGAGRLMNCSSKMNASFAASCPLAGIRFWDLVHPRDHRLLQGLIDSALHRRDLAPVIVTCQTGAGALEFESKIIPYAVTEDMLKICLQVQGEKRRRADLAEDSEPAFVGTYASGGRGADPETRVGAVDDGGHARAAEDSSSSLAYSNTLFPTGSGNNSRESGSLRKSDGASDDAMIPLDEFVGPLPATPHGTRADRAALQCSGAVSPVSVARADGIECSSPRALRASMSGSAQASPPPASAKVHVKRGLVTVTAVHGSDRSGPAPVVVGTAEVGVQTGEPPEVVGTAEVGVQTGEPHEQELLLDGKDAEVFPTPAPASRPPPLPGRDTVDQRIPEPRPANARHHASTPQQAPGNVPAALAHSPNPTAASVSLAASSEEMTTLNLVCSAAGCAPTTLESKCTSLACLMEHWCLPVLPGTCCLWHLSLEEVWRLAKSLRRSPCARNWHPLSGKQCLACTGTSAAGTADCVMCQTPFPQVSGDVAPPSRAAPSQAGPTPAATAPEEPPTPAGADCEEGALGDVSSSLVEDSD